MREKFELLGIVCLAVSLILKPHDVWLIWLYFMIAGGRYRKRSLQCLAIASVLSLPGIVSVTTIAPHWFQEFRSNMAELSVHGGVADPGPASSGAHALAMQINLQTAVSMFRDDPSFYNPVTYSVCGILLVAWLIQASRSKGSPELTWISLAAGSALSMLPVYHRQADAELLLLAVPACSILWARRGSRAVLAFMVTCGCLVLTAEIPWAFALNLLRRMTVSDTFIFRETIIGVQILPIPISLLMMSIFYLSEFAIAEKRYRLTVSGFGPDS